jgi:hypothetical protein
MENKVKRPPSVWIAQVFLVLLAILNVSVLFLRFVSLGYDLDKNLVTTVFAFFWILAIGWPFSFLSSSRVWPFTRFVL